LFLQEQVSYLLPKSSVLTLQTIHLLGVINLQTAVILTPAVVTLLRDIRDLACNGDALSLGCLNRDLAEHQHDLLRAWTLPSLHPHLLRSRLILAINTIQSQLIRSARK
jgi:hypothetical protein